ncbi:MAG: hypothetical protein ACREGR_01585 [Minisyncoccia bacterium]
MDRFIAAAIAAGAFGGAFPSLWSAAGFKHYQPTYWLLAIAAVAASTLSFVIYATVSGIAPLARVNTLAVVTLLTQFAVLTALQAYAVGGLRWQLIAGGGLIIAGVAVFNSHHA